MAGQPVRRGDIWTVAAPGDYTSKPRPAVVVQDDLFEATGSVTICAFTTDPTEAPLFRVLVEPSEGNGLSTASRLMVDKVTTIRRDRLGQFVGRLASEDLVRVNRALMVFLGLAGSPKG